MASEIHVNDVGTKFLITVKDSGVVVNVSGANVLQIDFRKPDDSIFSRSGTIYTDGSDGKIYYNTIAGDLNEAGNWKIQGKISPSGGGTYYTDIHTFKVHRNLYRYKPCLGKVNSQQ